MVSLRGGTTKQSSNNERRLPRFARNDTLIQSLTRFRIFVSMRVHLNLAMIPVELGEPAGRKLQNKYRREERLPNKKVVL